MNFTEEQKNKLGLSVADLKTYLHDVENCISEHRMQHINFDLLQEKLNNLLNLCRYAGTVSTNPPSLTTSKTTDHKKNR